MIALDLFCGAGGSAKGLNDAGFEVLGMDILPQPHYPFEFAKADVTEIDNTLLEECDFIWASPPCQAYSWAAKRWKKDYPDLVAYTRARLIASGKPYVIENVVGAPLIKPITLCGTMFDLKVFRHRKFESNVKLRTPFHPNHSDYGKVKNKQMLTVAGHGGAGKTNVDIWRNAMGINWMTKKELTQAIPPVFSEFIGKQVMRHITKEYIYIKELPDAPLF